MRTHLAAFLLLTAILVPVPSRAGDASPVPADKAVAAVLDDFHDAASKADGPRYFGHFAAAAVFLGTDATERWTIEEFHKFVDPYFARGQGWTYTPRERHIAFDSSGTTAWFDEELLNDSYGVCRGTGVLVKERGAWRIAQYNLMIPIPNDLAKDVVAMIRAQKPDKE